VQEEWRRRHQEQRRRPKLLLFPALLVPPPEEEEATLPPQTPSRPRTGSGVLTQGADARSRSSGEWGMQRLFCFSFTLECVALRLPPPPSRRRRRFRRCPQPCNFSHPFSTRNPRRLKVHYRAPPDIRGSGKERGHGTELQYCPRCGKELKAGKHHVGCFAGRSAPRQAAKRFRLVRKSFFFVFFCFGIGTSSVETCASIAWGSFGKQARGRRSERQDASFLFFFVFPSKEKKKKKPSLACPRRRRKPIRDGTRPRVFCTCDASLSVDSLERVEITLAYPLVCLGLLSS